MINGVVPVIDIGPALIGSGRRDVVDQLRAAISSVGFLQIVGHGFPGERVDAAYRSMWELETWSEDRLAEVLRPRAASRGVFQKFGDDGRLEQMAMQFIPYDTAEEAEALGASRGHLDFFSPNVWPTFAPDFRDIWKRYGAAARTLGRQLMSMFAEALDLPVDHYEADFVHDVTLFSVNWYPKQPRARTGAKAVVLNRAHADSGMLTIVHQRGNYEGLQVRGESGWVTVPIIDDAFVLNIGHLMRRATNGSWPATIHRVVSGHDEGAERKSIAMHFMPNIDTVVAPVPSTVGEDGPLFEPISTYSWQAEYMAEYALADWVKPTQTAAIT